MYDNLNIIFRIEKSNLINKNMKILIKYKIKKLKIYILKNV